MNHWKSYFDLDDAYEDRHSLPTWAKSFEKPFPDLSARIIRDLYMKPVLLIDYKKEKTNVVNPFVFYKSYNR